MTKYFFRIGLVSCAIVFAYYLANPTTFRGVTPDAIVRYSAHPGGASLSDRSRPEAFADQEKSMGTQVAKTGDAPVNREFGNANVQAVGAIQPVEATQQLAYSASRLQQLEQMTGGILQGDIDQAHDAIVLSRYCDTSAKEANRCEELKSLSDKARLVLKRAANRSDPNALFSLAQVVSMENTEEARREAVDLLNRMHTRTDEASALLVSLKHIAKH